MAIEWEGTKDAWKGSMLNGTVTFQVICTSGRWLYGMHGSGWHELKATEPDAAKSEALRLVAARLRECLEEIEGPQPDVRDYLLSIEERLGDLTLLDLDVSDIDELRGIKAQVAIVLERLYGKAATDG